ncbi:MAG TPA: glucose PTS transporter subunit IIA, partial [Kofleriaceae bacterium]|nr:glucose PTS transporter subunit IIA [Kofleriaceae bacterium]
MTTLVLAAPLAGWAAPLAEVPDPAFAEGMVGDGVAIDPTSNELCAPCDGVIVSVHRAHHAVTLRTAIGVDLLLHIGIDTVELKGQGYQVLVKDGQRVRIGEPLIRFDLDFLSRKAKSLHTPIVIVEGEGFAVIERTVGREVAVGDMLMAIARVGAADAPAAAPQIATGAVERRARVLVPHGLHARPAAAFAHRARQHAGDVTVACRAKSANGKSMVALMALDARLGDDVTITASGAGAAAVVGELAALVADGHAADHTADPATDQAAAATPAPSAATGPIAPGTEVVLTGAAAAAGLA